MSEKQRATMAPIVSLHRDLAAVWNQRVQDDPRALALIFEQVSWSREALDHRIRSSAAWLRGLGLTHGDKVVLMLDNGPDFLSLFLGCQRIGVIPVPLAPKSSIKRLAYVQEDCSSVRVILAPNHHLLQKEDIPGLTSLPGEWPEPGDESATPGRLALIQYTSGSTTHSKGVMVSQQAVLANIDAFAPTMGLEPNTIFSSLMPLFHDMGLVGFGLAPLLLGHPLFLYRQEALSLFEWLNGISTHRVTHTGGSDSLLRIACRVVGDATKYDLSSLRMLVCGSEPILESTLVNFGAKFQVAGALCPAYGMAELTLCAAAMPVGEPWRRDAQGHVSCGRPVGEVELKVLPPDGPGEIFVKSPAVMDGYWGRTDTGIDANGFLATGDLGYVDQDGYLYVMGRLKNLIIRNGAKYCAHDLEALAVTIPEVRRAAVVQLDHTQGLEGKVVAVLEVNRFLLSDTPTLETLAKGFRLSCTQAVGLTPDQVWFVSGGAIPATENGKIKHRILAEDIASGRFQPGWCFPEIPAQVPNEC